MGLHGRRVRRRRRPLPLQMPLFLLLLLKGGKLLAQASEGLLWLLRLQELEVLLAQHEEAGCLLRPHRGKIQGVKKALGEGPVAAEDGSAEAGETRREEWDPGLLLKPRRSLIIPKALQALRHQAHKVCATKA